MVFIGYKAIIIIIVGRRWLKGVAIDYRRNNLYDDKTMFAGSAGNCINVSFKIIYTIICIFFLSQNQSLLSVTQTIIFEIHQLSSQTYYTNC